MPQLQQYERQIYPKAVDLPEIPLSFGQAEDAAIGQAAEKVSNVGFALAKERIDLQLQSQLVDLHTEAAERLMTLRRKTLTSPGFYEDPDATALAFDSEVKKLQQEYFTKIQNPALREAFKKQFASESLSNISHVMDAVAKQRMANGEGRYYSGIMRLQRMAEGADTDDEALKYLGAIEGIYNTMEKSGLVKPENRVKELEKRKSDFAEHRMLAIARSDPERALDMLGNKSGIASLLRPDRQTEFIKTATTALEHKRNVSRLDEERAKKAAIDTGNQGAYDTLFTQFNLNDPARADYAGAVAFAQDPANKEMLGLHLDDTQVPTVSGRIETMWKQRQSAYDDAVKKTQDNFTTGFVTGQIKADQLYTWRDPKTGMAPTGEKIKEAQNYLANPPQPRQSDDATLLDLTEKISNRVIVDEGPVNQALTSGAVTQSDWKRLRELLSSRQDITKSGWFDFATKIYNAKFEDPGSRGHLTPEARAMYPQFLINLDQAVRTNNLRGTDVEKYVNQMLGDLENNMKAQWFKPWSWVGYGGRPQTAVEFATEWGGFPKPEQVESPTAIKQPIPVPPDARAKYEGILQKAGKPVTDANIKYLFDQDKAR